MMEDKFVSCHVWLTESYTQPCEMNNSGYFYSEMLMIVNMGGHFFLHFQFQSLICQFPAHNRCDVAAVFLVS